MTKPTDPPPTERRGERRQQERRKPDTADQCPDPRCRCGHRHYGSECCLYCDCDENKDTRIAGSERRRAQPEACEHCIDLDKRFAQCSRDSGAWQYRNEHGHWVTCPTQQKPAPAAPAPTATGPLTERRSGNSKLSGRPLDDNGSVELHVEQTSGAARNVATPDCIWTFTLSDGEKKAAIALVEKLDVTAPKVLQMALRELQMRVFPVEVGQLAASCETTVTGRMPSCHVCGTIMEGVCPKCQTTTAPTLPQVTATRQDPECEKAMSAYAAALLEEALSMAESTVVKKDFMDWLRARAAQERAR